MTEVEQTDSSRCMAFSRRFWEVSSGTSGRDETFLAIYPHNRTAEDFTVVLPSFSISAADSTTKQQCKDGMHSPQFFCSSL